MQTTISKEFQDRIPIPTFSILRMRQTLPHLYPHITSNLRTLTDYNLTPSLLPGRHHPARRQRQQGAPLRPRPRRRHRAIPLQDHPPHVQDAPGEA